MEKVFGGLTFAGFCMVAGGLAAQWIYREPSRPLHSASIAGSYMWKLGIPVLVVGLIGLALS